MASIEMKNIVKQYGDGFPAVNDVSLDIDDGEFMILVGPSGCGKSTLLRMIVGLEDITSGDMIIGGKRVNDLAPRDRNLSMVFQNYALYPHMTVFENIAFPLRLSKTPDDEVRRRVTEASDVLELKEHLERKPANLSGGQRQRVAMGRAIVRQAEAFLFDEPLSNLDAKLRGQMRTEISRLQRRLGITTVYVTHDQTEAMTLGDRVCVLRKGKIQQVASPRELYEQPVNLFVAGFIGSPPMNFLPATLEGDRLKTPFGRSSSTRSAAQASGAGTWCWSASGPEYFDDASLVEEPSGRWARRSGRGSTSPSGWATPSSPTSRTRRPRRITAQLRDLSRELDSEELRTQAVVSIDSTSRIREGQEAEFWLDSRKVHVFDPAVRGEPDPRRRGRRRADPAGDAGPGGAGGGVQGAAGRRRDLGRRRLNPAPEVASAGEWWRSAVVYEVYLRSFADSDGDGVGDIGGLRGKLPYLADLGVDAVWITPWYPSPMADGGYDVSDYCDIDPRFGTLADADALIADAHAARAAGDHRPGRQPHLRASTRGSPRRWPPGPGRPEREPLLLPRRPGRRRGAAQRLDQRLRRPGVDAGRASPTARPGSGTCTRSPRAARPRLGAARPSARTSTTSCGSGSTAASTGCGSTRRRPWRRCPACRTPGTRPGRGSSRAPGSTTRTGTSTASTTSSGGGAAIGDSYDGDRLFVTEAVVRGPERLSRYVRPDEMHTSFNFDYLTAPWEPAPLRAVIDEQPRRAGAGRRARHLGALQPRRDPARHPLRAADTGAGFGGAAVTASPSRPGPRRCAGPGRRRCSRSPCPARAYIYQGEELGLPEVEDLPEEVLQDPTWERSGRTDRGRDGCRVPLPWAGDRRRSGSPPTASSRGCRSRRPGRR